jgi:hypothetical protein
LIWLERFFPAVAITASVVLCALPWGLEPEFRLVLPLLPYVVIHRCVERFGDASPDWFVFLAGLATDVAGQGPLGFWCLIYLSGFTMIRSVTVDRDHSAGASIFLFVVTITTLVLMQWSAASIYYVRPVEMRPLVLSATTATALYLALLVLIPARRGASVRMNARLERGL